jgi:hypothetical protein
MTGHAEDAKRGSAAHANRSSTVSRRDSASYLLRHLTDVSLLRVQITSALMYLGLNKPLERGDHGRAIDGVALLRHVGCVERLKH